MENTWKRSEHSVVAPFFEAKKGSGAVFAARKCSDNVCPFVDNASL